MHYVFAIITAIILYLLQNHYYSKHWNQHLSASISYSKTHANIGEIVTLTERITNAKRLPVPVLHAKFNTSRTFIFDDTNNASVSDYYHRNDMFSIMGNQQITRTLKFRTSKRGYYSTEYVDLIANDIFQKNSYATRLENHTSLYVYPMRLNDRYSLSVTNSILGSITKRDLFEDPLSFRGIRDYTNGDSVRHVNWKVTAKQQQLMVNTYFDVQSTEVILLLNLNTHTIQRNHQLQESILSVAATLLHHMVSKDFAIRLAVNIPDPFTDNVPITELGKGEEHLHSMLQILARLDLSKNTTAFDDFFTDTYSFFNKTSHNTTVLIISNERTERILTHYRTKQEQGHQLQFICPEEPKHCTPASFLQYWEVKPYEF